MGVFVAVSEQIDMRRVAEQMVVAVASGMPSSTIRETRVLAAV
jgi:hypothetical protein